MQVFNFSEFLSSGGDRNLKRFVLTKSYERIAWVYACINRIAVTASSAPLKFYKEKRGKRDFRRENMVDDVDHPLNSLFNPPSPPDIVSLSDLLYRTFIHLGTDGLLYWVIDRKKREPENIRLLNRTELKPLLSNNKMLVGWEEIKAFDQGEGKKYTIKDVLPIKYYNPNSKFDGLSPLHAARLSLEQEFQIAGWNASFFKSGMKNPVSITANGKLTNDQKREINREINSYYSGIDGGNSALVLGGGVTVKPLDISPKDIDFINGKKLTREEICAIFGVPPALVGLFEYSNYSNTREQQRIFWDQTLFPKLKLILDLIQVNILDIHFPGFYAGWDLTAVSGLSPDPVEMAAAAIKYKDMGYHPAQIAHILKAPELIPDDNWIDTRGQENTPKPNGNDDRPIENPDGIGSDDPPPASASIVSDTVEIKSDPFLSGPNMMLQCEERFYEALGAVVKAYEEDPKCDLVELYKDVASNKLLLLGRQAYYDAASYDDYRIIRDDEKSYLFDWIEAYTNDFEKVVEAVSSKGRDPLELHSFIAAVSVLFVRKFVNKIRAQVFIVLGFSKIQWHNVKDMKAIPGIFDLSDALEGEKSLPCKTGCGAVIVPKRLDK